MIRVHHLKAQTERAWCLPLAANAVIAWTTEYHGLAVEQLRRGSYLAGVSAGGNQAPVVKSWRRASSFSSPHLVAVSR